MRPHLPLAGLILAPCVLAAQAAAVGAGRPAPYEGLLVRARQGDIQSVTVEMLGWSEDETAQQSRTLRNDRGCDECRMTAVLLHTEAAAIALRTGQKDTEASHRHAASQIAAWLLRDAGGERRRRATDFEHRWLLAVGYQYQELVGPRPAVEIFRSLLERYPDDPETLVGLGALYDHIFATPLLATESGVPVPLPATYYEKALAVAPSHVEARLRLGAVATRHKRWGDARVRLGQVLEQEAAPLVRAFALFFLGEAEIGDGNAERAVQHYRAALAVEPHLQPAHLALSRALQRLGRGAEATQQLLEGLHRTSDGEIVSWHSYHTSALHGYRQSMDRLWQEVRD